MCSQPERRTRTCRSWAAFPSTTSLWVKRVSSAFLEPVAELLRQGGYVPFADHSVPPDTSWPLFKYYRERLNEIIDKGGAA